MYTHIHMRAQECVHEMKDVISTHNATKCQQLVNLAEECNAVHCITLVTFCTLEIFSK